jgi:hypothetical protein
VPFVFFHVKNGLDESTPLALWILINHKPIALLRWIFSMTPSEVSLKTWQLSPDVDIRMWDTITRKIKGQFSTLYKKLAWLCRIIAFIKLNTIWSYVLWSAHLFSTHTHTHTHTQFFPCWKEGKCNGYFRFLHIAVQDVISWTSGMTLSGISLPLFLT